MSNVVAFGVTGTDTASIRATFTAVSQVRGVTSVRPLSSTSTVLAVQQMGTAEIRPGLNAREVAIRIRTVPGIEYAEVPAERGLPGPTPEP